MEDFTAPSFSLGLDFDFDSEPQTSPKEESRCKQAPESSKVVNVQTFDEDEVLLPQTLDPDQQIEDPPPVLKRLRRGPSVQHSVVTEADYLQFCSNIDDEIEDFSSQEDPCRVDNEHSSVQNNSACSSSKFQLNEHRVLTTQSVSESKVRRRMPTPNVSTSATLVADGNLLMFPELTVSPLRKFQLIDSDSDDPTADEDLGRDVNRIALSANKRQSNLGRSATKIEQKGKASASALQPEDLWKGFCPKKTVNIPTPALDEFCDEYFRTAREKNATQRQENDPCISGSRGSCKNSNTNENVENCGCPINPPSYQYFFDDDPMIRKLVHSRLSHFYPLGAVNNEGNNKYDLLWKGFCPKKTVNIPTPAWDEFCDEYFRTASEKNATQRQENDPCISGSRGSCKNSKTNENVENCGCPINPPAHQYFFHDDPMIRKLVHSRLPHFYPLGAVNNQGNNKCDLLWKGFCPKKTVNIPTPALDEFCDEYFRTASKKNATQRQENDPCISGSRGSCKTSNTNENVENCGYPINPPAHQYFFHDDPMIRKLVHNRLPHFYPLGAVNNQGNNKCDLPVIDYMSQFSHREGASQHGTRNVGSEGSLKRRRNSKSSNAVGVSEALGNCVNPKTCAGLPKDAGKRRVHAEGRVTGHWFTGPDGKKVYVTKRGQELSGRNAYRHYRQESRAGIKKSKKKASAKKKTKR